MYRIIFHDKRPPINVEADKMQCSPGCIEFFKKNEDGHFEKTFGIETDGVKDAEPIGDEK